jgi:hypothetical protein
MTISQVLDNGVLSRSDESHKCLHVKLSLCELFEETLGTQSREDHRTEKVRVLNDTGIVSY